MSANKKNQDFPTFLLIISGLISAGGFFAFYFFMIKNHDFLLFLVSYIIAISLSLVAYFRQKLKSQDTLIPLLMVILVTMTGPFGAFILFTTLLLGRIFGNRSTDFSEWFASMFPENEDDNEEKIYERIIFGLEDEVTGDSHVEPYSNIISYGSLRQKQSVIARISRYFRPIFTPILLKALNSPENAVRVQAAAVLAKIENQYTEKYIEFEKKFNKELLEISEALTFVDFCLEYLETGILDRDRTELIITKSVAALGKITEKKTHEWEIESRLGRLYFITGEYTKSADTMARILERNNIEPGNEIILTYIEALFKSGQFSKIRNLANKWRNTYTGKNDVLAVITDFWSRPGLSVKSST